MKKNIKYEWNLKSLYTSENDIKLEKDILNIEIIFNKFSTKYDSKDKSYLNDSIQLLKALTEYENIYKYSSPPSLVYLFYRRSLDGSNNSVNAKMSLYSDRYARIINSVKFFPLALGSIASDQQEEFLIDPSLKHYRFLLKNIFDDAKYYLSLAEEKILSLKRLPSRDMWVSHSEKLLNNVTANWKGKKLPLSELRNLIEVQTTQKLRDQLSNIISDGLRSVAPFAEGEINAIFTDKKIDDELRGYKTPYEETVREYQNDPLVVENLRKVVTDNFSISHRFYKIKSKILKLKKLRYFDRAAKFGKSKKKYSFEFSIDLLKDIFGSIDKKYSIILDSYVKNGQIDVKPKKDKEGGAYCSSNYLMQTFVLLNHSNTQRCFETLAHEMGHAFHGELSRIQGPIYSNYSYSLAETASTLFESIASEAIFNKLSDKEKIITLHDKINGDIATIFRQIACFNFELELHNVIREKGYVSKEEICTIHNKHMKAYLGPVFEMVPDDGLNFVSWGHIRRFFYVYSYAYGMLVSKALLRRYRADNSYWKSIEIFLSSGGKDTPENILKEIGIDLYKPDFFIEGLKEIENDIIKLEKLVLKK